MGFSNNMKSLYVHIPFCNCICSYCDFYKMIAKEETKKNYIEYLIKELYQKKNYLKNIKTIYIGGGSPSSLPVNVVDFLLYHISKVVNIDKVSEFTFECNPMDITSELCKVLSKYHVNRVSIGVQSFDKEKLAILSRNYLNKEDENKFSSFRRIHTQKDVKKAVRLLQKNGIKNINFDFIYGLNNEKFKDFKKDLTIAINMGITHISTYSLILEDKTILGLLSARGEFKPMDPDYEYKFYTKIQKFLNHAGFNQYEISNFALRKRQSKHNLAYWNNENYIGVGAAASFYIDNVRYTNVMNIKEYCQGVEKEEYKYLEVSYLTKKEQMDEEMMLGFRKVSGVNLRRFEEKFNTTVFDAYPIINKFLEEKLLRLKRNHLYIPKKKMYISNEILINFV